MPRPDRQSRNAEVDFRGGKRPIGSHAWTNDPDVQLYRKSPGTCTILRFMGPAERQTASAIIYTPSPGSIRQQALGADRGYDAASFVRELRQALCQAAFGAEILAFRNRRPDHRT